MDMPRSKPQPLPLAIQAFQNSLKMSHSSAATPADIKFKADVTSLSEFPSLSGGPRPQQSNNNNSSANSASWNSNAIRQPSAQQQPQVQQPQQRTPSAAPSQQSLDQFDGQRSQQPSADRAGGGDDFPPLSGQINGDALGQTNGFTSGLASSDVQPRRTNGQQTQLPTRDGSNAFQQSHQPPIGQPVPQSHVQTSQHVQPSSTSSTVKKYADMTENEKWGLPGLMAIFEARKQRESGGEVDDTLPVAMRSAVMMGHDLNSSGLDLDSPEPLYPTFTPFQTPGNSGSSTLDFHDRLVVPDFNLTSAYTVTNVPPLASRMSAFSDGEFSSMVGSIDSRTTASMNSAS